MREIFSELDFLFLDPGETFPVTEKLIETDLESNFRNQSCLQEQIVMEKTDFVLKIEVV